MRKRRTGKHWMLGEVEPTVPYSLPLLLMATNSSLFTPYRLTTPRSTAEISIRPEQKARHRVRIQISPAAPRTAARKGVVQGRARCLCSTTEQKARSDQSHRDLLTRSPSPLRTGQSGFGTSEGVGVKISCYIRPSIRVMWILYSDGYICLFFFFFSK